MKKFKNKIYKSSTLEAKYQEYQNRLKGREEYLQRSGIFMYRKPRQITQLEFSIRLFGEENKDKKSSTSKLIDRMVTNAFTDVTEKQALAYFRAHPEDGSVLAIRYNITMWLQIKAEYEQLVHDAKIAGVQDPSKLASKLISETYFGSPE